MAVLGAQAAEEPDITDAGWRRRENTKIWPNTTEGPVHNNPYTFSGQYTNHPHPSLSNCAAERSQGGRWFQLIRTVCTVERLFT